MASRHKVFTKDCHSCDKLEILEMDTHICKWGKSRTRKLLLQPKGKSEIRCRLIDGRPS